MGPCDGEGIAGADDLLRAQRASMFTSDEGREALRQ